MAGYRVLRSVQRQYWEFVARGISPTAAGPLVGVSGRCGQDWFRIFGGVKPLFDEPRGRVRPRLSFTEREEIMIGTAAGESIRSMARRLGRAPSTIMREIYLNGRCGMQRAATVRCIGLAATVGAGTRSRRIGPAWPRSAARRGRAAQMASWPAALSCAKRCKGCW